MDIRIIIAIFAVHLKGSGLCRGTTRERSGVTMGRFMTAFEFGLCLGARDLSPKALLFCSASTHWNGLL